VSVPPQPPSSGLNTGAPQTSAGPVPAPPLLPPPAKDPAALIDANPQLAPYRSALLRLYDDYAAAAAASNILDVRTALLKNNVLFDKLLEYPEPLILTLFLKLFALQDKYLTIKGDWPPFTGTEPSIIEVVGIHNETTPQAVVRILRNLRPNATPAENFQEIKRLMAQNDDPAVVVGLLTGTPPDSAEKILTELSQPDKLDRDLILFNPSSQSERYIPVFFKEPATYDHFLYRLEWYNKFVETPENMSFEQKIFVLATNASFFLQSASKDSQYIVILPAGATIDAVLDKYNRIARESGEPELFELPVWISSNLIPTSLAKPDFFVVQGYRSRKFPCPQLLVSLSQEIPRLSPAAEAMYPEWRSREQITTWLAGVLAEWYTDILAMRSATVADRDRRDTQLRLFYHVVAQVRAGPSATAVAAVTTRAAAEESIVQPAATNNTGRRRRLAANVAALAVAANTVDPNQLFQQVDSLKGKYADILAENLKQRPAVRALIDPLPPRRRGWFTGESKETYRRTIKNHIDLFRQMYGAPTLPSANSSRADTLTMILNQGTDARAAWTAFKAWRESEPRLFDGSTASALTAEIAAVGPKGFFTGTSAYMRRLRNLLRRVYPVTVGGSRKIRALSRKRTKMVRKSQRSRRRTQKGGATPMPLAYYQPGAATMRTSADPTGVGLATTNATWARAPLPRQAGGWMAPPPSVMGAFVANGMRLMPVAAYMGYKQTRSSRRRTTNKRGKI